MNLYSPSIVGPTTSDSSYTGTAFIKVNGTSAQFLKADGSVDATTYQTFIAAGTTAQYWRGDKTWQTLPAAYVHPAYTALTPVLTGALVLATLTTDAIGSVTGATTRTLTLANLGYTGATNANYFTYTHPTGDGNLHVPATSTTNNGKVLMAGATAGSLSWATPSSGTTNLTTTHAATTVTVNSDTGTDAVINGATATLAGVITTGIQVFAGSKTFNAAITVVGEITSQNDFRSSTTTVLLGTQGIGTVYLRPYNYASPTAQTTLTTSLATIGTPLTVVGSVTATSFLESSLRELKENILPFTMSGLAIINSLNIVTYDRISGAKNKIGVIIDDSPKEVANEDKTAVDLYKTIFIQAKAIQELTARLEKIENSK